MAFTGGTGFVGTAIKSPAGTLVATANASVAVGKVAYVSVATLAIDTGVGPYHTNFQDDAGNTWSKIGERARETGDNPVISLWRSLITNAVTSGVTQFTATFHDSGHTVRGMVGGYFNYDNAGSTVQSDSAAGTAANSGTTYAVSESTGSVKALLEIGCVVYNDDDVITEDATFTHFAQQGTSGGSATSNIRMAMGYRIQSASSDSFNATTSSSQRWAAILTFQIEVATATYVDLGGVCRAASRLAGATLTSTLDLTAGRARPIQRSTRAELTQTLDVSGTARSIARLRGDISMDVLLQGVARALSRLAGAELTQTLSLSGVSRASARLSAASLTSELDLAGAPSRTFPRLLGSELISALLLDAGHVRALSRIAGASLETFIELAGVSRNTARLLGAELASDLALSGLTRHLGRNPGASLTGELSLGGGTVRVTVRAPGAELATDVLLAGTSRSAVRLLGAQLTSTLDFGGTSRGIARPRGADLSSDLALGGTARAAARIPGTLLTSTIDLTAGKLRIVHRVSAAELTSELALSGSLKAIARALGATLSAGEFLELAGLARAIAILRGAELTFLQFSLVPGPRYVRVKLGGDVSIEDFTTAGVHTSIEQHVWVARMDSAVVAQADGHVGIRVD